ncbi:MAG: chromate transporter [Hyphomicrobium sp.]
MFGRIGLLSFGGPAAQIALMHRELVEEQRWLDERRFLSALSFCSAAAGSRGDAACDLFGLAAARREGRPCRGAAVRCARSAAGAGAVGTLRRLWQHADDRGFVRRREGRGACHRSGSPDARRQARHSRALDWAVAVAAFVAIFFLNLPFPLVILGAAAAGYF